LQIINDSSDDLSHDLADSENESMSVASIATLSSDDCAENTSDPESAAMSANSISALRIDNDSPAASIATLSSDDCAENTSEPESAPMSANSISALRIDNDSPDNGETVVDTTHEIDDPQSGEKNVSRVFVTVKVPPMDYSLRGSKLACLSSYEYVHFYEKKKGHIEADVGAKKLRFANDHPDVETYFQCLRRTPVTPIVWGARLKRRSVLNAYGADATDRETYAATMLLLYTPWTVMVRGEGETYWDALIRYESAIASKTDDEKMFWKQRCALEASISERSALASKVKSGGTEHEKGGVHGDWDDEDEQAGLAHGYGGDDDESETDGLDIEPRTIPLSVRADVDAMFAERATTSASAASEQSVLKEIAEALVSGAAAEEAARTCDPAIRQSWVRTGKGVQSERLPNLGVSAPSRKDVFIAVCTDNILPTFSARKKSAERSPNQPVINARATADEVAVAYGLDTEQYNTFAFAVLGSLRAYLFGIASKRCEDDDDVHHSLDDVDNISVEQRAEAERIFERYGALLTHLKHQSMRIFVGGQGGSGKSRSVAAFLAYAKAWGFDHRVVVCAPTGSSAAAHVGGTTWHKVVNWNMRVGGVWSESAVQAMIANSELADLLMLIMDESLMTSAADLALFEVAVRRMSGDRGDTPFGGIPLLFLGDHLQLPPAMGAVPLYAPQSEAVRAVERAVRHAAEQAKSKADKKKADRGKGSRGGEAEAESRAFATEAKRRIGTGSIDGVATWNSMFTHAVEHKHNYRSTDDSFAQFLTRMRKGTTNVADLVKLKSCAVEKTENPRNLASPSVMSSWKEIAAVNFHHVLAIGDALNVTVYDFVAKVESIAGTSVPDVLGGYVVGSDCKKDPPSHLLLYIGAPVVLYPEQGNAYIDEGVANGSIGRFIGTYPPLSELVTAECAIDVCGKERKFLRVVQSPEFLLVEMVGNDRLNMPNLTKMVFPVPLRQKKKTINGHTMTIFQFTEVKVGFAGTM
jgi:hypothetical protein